MIKFVCQYIVLNNRDTILMKVTILYVFSILKDAIFLMSTPHYQNKKITKNDTDISSIVL